MTRPISVTVVAWVIITLEFEAMVAAFSGLAGTLFKVVHISELPVPTLVWVTVMSASLCMLCGIFMLKGAEWARVVYFILKGLGTLGMLIGFSRGTTNPVLFVSVLIKLAVFAYFLFRAEGTAYFEPRLPVADVRVDESGSPSE
jgi:hypothetical protein